MKARLRRWLDQAPPGRALDDARLVALVLLGTGAAVWSWGYDRWRLPPQVYAWGTPGRSLAGDVLPMLVAPLVLALVLGLRPRDVGLRLRPLARSLAAGLLAFGVIAPALVVFASRAGVCAAYPSPTFPPAREHLNGLLVHWLVNLVPQMLAVEALFRGALLLPLGRRIGIERAMALVLGLYVLLHAQKPAAELWLAAGCGVVFSLAAWRTGSIAPAFLAHWLVAASVDLACFLRLHGRI